MAATWFAADNLIKWEIANSIADNTFKSIGTGQVYTNSKVPVVRTACGPPQTFPGITQSIELPIPVLSQHAAWGDPEAEVPELGPLKDFSISDPRLANFSIARQPHAKWFLLPPEYGDATAGLAIVTRNNASYAAGMGCVVDARWADGSIYYSWGGAAGTLWGYTFPQQTPPFSTGRPGHFLDAQNVYSSVVKADQGWLDASNLPLDTGVYTNGNLTNFELLLNVTELNDALFVANDSDCANLLGYVPWT